MTKLKDRFTGEYIDTIECPYCGRTRVGVYKGAKGRTSQYCAKCKGTYIADFDNMEAIKCDHMINVKQACSRSGIC
ncbi:MAG: hypothetical protein LUE14_09260 [Clostridiales bacterium]|nr:hypothetical protein [Clostridiales bacterium]